MVKAQKWLDRNYPNEGRKSVKGLDISGKNLEGHLDLRDFPNLETLKCSCNKLISLNISSCLKLRNLDCGFNGLKELNSSNLGKLERISFNDNFITVFDYSSLNPDNLKCLNISDNSLSGQDLSVFSRFANLRILWVGGDNKEWIQQGSFNRFYGNLKSLQYLTKLEEILISNTDIDGGLEYLPKSVKRIYSSTEARPESKVKVIGQELKPFTSKQEVCDFQAWKKMNLNLVRQILDNDKILSIASIINSALNRNPRIISNQLTKEEKVFQVFIFSYEEETRECRKKLYQANEHYQTRVETNPYRW